MDAFDFYLIGHKIDQAMTNAPAPRPDPQARTNLQSLEDRVERLSLACGALWKLVKERTGATDQELMAVMAEIDLEDGVADGKVKRGPVTCASCSKANSRRRKYCIYCGEHLPLQPFE